MVGGLKLALSLLALRYMDVQLFNISTLSENELRHIW